MTLKPGVFRFMTYWKLWDEMSVFPQGITEGVETLCQGRIPLFRSRMIVHFHQLAAFYDSIEDEDSICGTLWIPTFLKHEHHCMIIGCTHYEWLVVWRKLARCTENVHQRHPNSCVHEHRPTTTPVWQPRLLASDETRETLQEVSDGDVFVIMKVMYPVDYIFRFIEQNLRPVDGNPRQRAVDYFPSEAGWWPLMLLLQSLHVVNWGCLVEYT